MDAVLKSDKDRKPKYISKMKHWTESMVFAVLLNRYTKSVFQRISEFISLISSLQKSAKTLNIYGVFPESSNQN